jgi:hypothetical protein
MLQCGKPFFKVTRQSGVNNEIYSPKLNFTSQLQYTQGHIVIDVRHVGFDMSDNRSDGDRCNKKGHKTKELSQQV